MFIPTQILSIRECSIYWIENLGYVLDFWQSSTIQLQAPLYSTTDFFKMLSTDK